jgi:hypothetical protein
MNQCGILELKYALLCEMVMGAACKVGNKSFHSDANQNPT